MRNIKKSAPYKTRDKSWYYQYCLQETYKIFLDISQVIIGHDIVINRNAAPLSSIQSNGSFKILGDNVSVLKTFALYFSLNWPLAIGFYINCCSVIQNVSYVMEWNFTSLKT